MQHNLYAFALVVLMLGAFGAAAQGGAKKEQLEAMKVAFITNRLNLTPDEAQVFWPIYNLYETELEALRAKRKEDRRNMKDDFATATDKEIENYVDGEIAYKQEELDINKKYNTQFKKVLPMKKVAMLYKAQDDYKRELLKQIQEKGKK